METNTDESLIEDLILTMSSYEKCYLDVSEGFSKIQMSDHKKYEAVSICFVQFLYPGACHIIL